MPIPLEIIHKNIKEKQIIRINQIFEYGTIPEWKGATGFRKGLIERLMVDPNRFVFRRVYYLSQTTGIKETTLERLIEEQKKYNRAIKREGGLQEKHQGPQPEK